MYATFTDTPPIGETGSRYIILSVTSMYIHARSRVHVWLTTMSGVTRTLSFRSWKNTTRTIEVRRWWERGKMHVNLDTTQLRGRWVWLYRGGVGGVRHGVTIELRRMEVHNSGRNGSISVDTLWGRVGEWRVDGVGGETEWEGKRVKPKRVCDDWVVLILLWVCCSAIIVWQNECYVYYTIHVIDVFSTLLYMVDVHRHFSNKRYGLTLTFYLYKQACSS